MRLVLREVLKELRVEIEQCYEEGCSKEEGQQYGKICLPGSSKYSIQSEEVDVPNKDQLDWSYKA